MRDLAPEIVRQRILIEGYFTVDVDDEAIRSYFTRITHDLGLRTYGEPIVFAPGGEGRDENEGYDAFIPLFDSGISVYVWSRPKFVSVIAFTCKDFDVATAVASTQDFFGIAEIESMTF